MERISLTSNSLAGPIPAELGNLSNLTSLSLFANKLTGTIPSEFVNLTALDYFYVYDNHLDADAEGNALIPAPLQLWYEGIPYKDI